eukprot:Awhi_evm1s11415
MDLQTDEEYNEWLQRHEGCTTLTENLISYPASDNSGIKKAQRVDDPEYHTIVIKNITKDENIQPTGTAYANNDQV